MGLHADAPHTIQSESDAERGIQLEGGSHELKGWGELLLSKVLGLSLVLLFTWATWGGPAAIGLHSARIGPALAIAATGMGVLFLTAHGIQMFALYYRGTTATLLVAAVDPKTGLAGGLGFALFLVLANVVNALMEEGLFRGVLLRLFETRMTFWPANLTQAVLFALWHLVWPLKHWLLGSATLAAASEAGSLLGATLIAGVSFGYMVHATNSLWTPVVAHFLNNTVYNLVHLRTPAGVDKELGPVQVIATVGLLPLMLLVRLLAP